MPHTPVDVDTPYGKQALRSVNPRGGIPTLVIDGKVLRGFSPDAVVRAIRIAARNRPSR